jgi:hypothetical protein
MKKLLFVSATIVTSIVFSQAAFADTSLELSKDDLIAASQGYILTGSDERPAARRSELFAHILDSQKEGSTTLAQSADVVVTPES